MTRKNKGPRVRLAICLVMFLGGFLLLGFRAWQLQVASDGRVARLEERQVDRKIVLAPKRGSIFDARGRALALTLEVPSVFVDPAIITDPKQFVSKVSKVLGINPREVREKIRDKSKRFVWLRRKLDPAVEPKLVALELRGLGVVHESKRFYPDRELAAQVIGVVGADDEGLEGLEHSYDKFMRSQKLVVHTERDAKGRTVFTKFPVLMEPEAGADLELTIDSVVQHAVEKELVEAAQRSGSKKALAVIMDPRNGEILASASYPRVNPNRLNHTNQAAWRNRAIQEIFDPGSTLKVFTLATALEKRDISPSTLFDVRKGSLRVSGKVIRTHEPHSTLTPADILKYSDNIGTSRIAMKIGRQNFHEGLSQFGFGRQTGVDFPGEPSGLLSDWKKWRDVDLANISFGQGIGITAVQMVSALSVIANRGVSVEPHFVKAVRFKDGRSMEPQPKGIGRQVLSEQTALTITKWMEGVIDDGTAKEARMREFRAAGKTGTSQKIDPTTKSYSSKLVVSSMMGFAPISNPRLAALIVFDEPAKADYGGTLAAPVFRRVMEAALVYLGVQPDRAPEKEAQEIVVRDAIQSPTSEAAQSSVASGTLPDFRGLTVREVLSLVQKFELNVNVEGSGVAVRQFPEPGASLKPASKLKVVFQPTHSGGTDT